MKGIQKFVYTLYWCNIPLLCGQVSIYWFFCSCFEPSLCNFESEPSVWISSNTGPSQKVCVFYSTAVPLACRFISLALLVSLISQPWLRSGRDWKARCCYWACSLACRPVWERSYQHSLCWAPISWSCCCKDYRCERTRTDAPRLQVRHATGRKRLFSFRTRFTNSSLQCKPPTGIKKKISKTLVMKRHGQSYFCICSYCTCICI